MSTKTRRELVEKALHILVPLSGQAHSAEDVATMDSYVDSVIDDLAVRGVYGVQNVDAIEPAPFVYLAQMLASAARDEFGGATVDVATAEMRLRAQSAAKPTFETLRGEYY